MATYTGTPSTAVANAELAAATWNADVRNFVLAFGAWNSFTPTLSQGASSDITATKACEYLLISKLVIARYRVDATATGTAGSDITLTLPVTASTNGFVAGSAYFIDNDSTDYVAAAWIETTSTVRLATGSGKIGTSPAVTVASGDIFTMTIVYEAA